LTICFLYYLKEEKLPEIIMVLILLLSAILSSVTAYEVLPCPETIPVPDSKYNGNKTGCEYGDAVYRVLNMPAYNYNHAGIFAGLDSLGVPKARVALGSGTNAAEVPFYETFSSYGSKYYGAYTLEDVDLDFGQRRSIAMTAKEITDAEVPFTSDLIPVCIEYYGSSFDGSVSDMSGIRCDGLVEYAYEKNGFRVWSNKVFPDSMWSILKYPDLHNNKPGGERRPDIEMSPWAQRGAPYETGPYPDDPSSYPQPDTRLIRPSVIKPPLVQVFQTDSAGSAAVTIIAEDESGIHNISYMVPGGTEWVKTRSQPIDPPFDSYSHRIKLNSSGVLYVYATDKGGNHPELAQGYYIDIANPPYSGLIPDRTELKQNYPNPFNSSTTIRFSLEKVATVSLDIYDIRGRKTDTLKDGFMPAGYYSVEWSPENLPTGLYFCRFRTGDSDYVKKVILLK